MWDERLPNKSRRVLELIIAFAGISIIIFISIPGMIPWGGKSTVSDGSEDEKYQEMLVCLSTVCDREKCDKSFIKQYPLSNRIQEIPTVENELLNSLSCQSRYSAPPSPAPAPITSPRPPENAPNQQNVVSDARLAALEAAAEKWRSRTGPIHENLVDLLGSITAYDQNRFDKQPDAKEAWDYLQSIQKIINEKSIGITAENKNNISINVVVTGTNDIGDRAARALEEWLEENGFNTDKKNTDIYIDVDGVQSSSPRPYTTYSATTSLNLIARWLDGSRAFEIHIPPLSKSGGGRDDAEDRSFSDAVAKMISSFQAHVHQ